MPKIPTDSRMDFDYSVSTEDRFALRRWFEELVQAINYNDRGVYLEKLAPNLWVKGFTESPLNHQDYSKYLQSRAKQKVARVVRFPDLKIKQRYRHYFTLMGTYEEFINGILSYEGTVTLEIEKQDEQFKLSKFIFYPRLKLSPYI
jgi:hypothetical protein